MVNPELYEYQPTFQNAWLFELHFSSFHFAQTIFVNLSCFTKLDFLHSIFFSVKYGLCNTGYVKTRSKREFC